MGPGCEWERGGGNLPMGENKERFRDRKVNHATLHPGIGGLTILRSEQ